jgi:hypothetical protein
MKNAFALRLRAVLLGTLVSIALDAQAETVRYLAVDLPDAIAGEDLWRYDYQVTGSFGSFGGFNLLFDAARYAALSDPQPNLSPDWDLIVVQPDPTLFAAGLLTATAITTGGALDAPFSLQFVWLGDGIPGAQPYEVFNDSFDITERGVTRVVGQDVPEPQTAALVALALLALAARRSRK